MIIYTQAFLLAAAAAGSPLTLARILYDSLTRTASAGQVTASTTAAGYAADAPLRPDTFERWKPTALPATWQFDFGGVKSIDCVGIAGHNLADAAVSVKCEYQLGTGAWTTLANDAAPGDNSPVMFVAAAVNANRIRLTFTGGSAMPQIGVVYVGAALVMPQPIDGSYAPVSMSRETIMKASVSRGGQFLAQDFRRNGIANKIAFKYLQAAFMRASFDPFAKLARKYPFFLAWEPQDFPYEVGYVWAEKDIVPTLHAAW
jgi:hypothetical protein